MDVLSTVAIGIVAGFGGYLAISGQVTVGVVVAFLGYVQQFFWPIQQVGQIYTQAQSALAGGERIFELLDTPVDLADAPGRRRRSADRRAGRVRARVASPTTRRTRCCDDVSFVAEPGQTVALVGPTGAGKTTIVNLIARFYDVDRRAGAGRRRRRARRDRRPRCASRWASCPQNSFLFAGTIADNIRYGRLEATDEEVEAAARAGQRPRLHQRAARRATRRVLGERGGTLSQGQRQLIAFARAVLADPRILILDEATAAWTPAPRCSSSRRWRRCCEGRTSFVIAHRLSTVRNADQVLVIDDGRIVERGTHRELLAAGGALRRPLPPPVPGRLRTGPLPGDRPCLRTLR